MRKFRHYIRCMDKTDARATVDHAILNGMSARWGQGPMAMVDSIREALFSETTRWAVEEYARERAATRALLTEIPK